ncbi:hypothetical protein MYAM1_002871 [Malassezia yamatoensis]|uniref:t-SNARE coiled-coil homology domain-containing protein n=1 Tax=Malassezia yamatoensis TaxID=253288 RepID=A0AAJ6CHQ5_9BASI|nr:hypothetical protein MYAM1_002871 [Malassezia yamatoensis]
MRDPYEGSAAEFRRLLSTARELCDAIPSDKRAKYELESTLKKLRQDLTEIRETVRVVEQSGPDRFPLAPGELHRRKTFVEGSEKEVARLERALHQHSAHETSLDASRPTTSLAWEQEQQQQLLTTQDQALNQLGSSLSTIRSQAYLIGSEAEEQGGLLRELDSDVDQAQTALGAAVQRMDRFVTQADARLNGWCVWILIVVR